ncbi:MAG: hypothetical protein R2724_00195 [Bryobacterales bacterium]
MARYVYASPAGSEKAADDLARLVTRAEAGEISRVCVAAARLGIGQDANADLEAAFAARDPQLERLRLPLFGGWSKRELPWDDAA